MDGMMDKPFRSIIRVGTESFSSRRYFAQPEEAKEDAARVAYVELSARENKCDEFAKAFHLIDQEETLCMVILNDFHKRANIAIPSYHVIEPEGPCGQCIAAVSVGGNTYTGERANTEEEAKKNAARTVVKSILGTRNGCMLEIIFSKRQTEMTIQARQPSKMNVPPVVTAATPAEDRPCASKELMMQRQPPNMEVLHEQIQQYAPYLPMSFLRRELMKWNACVTSTSEMRPKLLPQNIPAGDDAVLPSGISANEHQDDNMIVDEVDGEEFEGLSGKKRKMEANEGPVDKQARTV